MKPDMTIMVWAKKVGVLAVRTAAQAGGALVTSNTTGLTHLDLRTIAVDSALAGLMCILHHLSDLKVSDPMTTVV